MGNKSGKPTRTIEFHLLSSLPASDVHPIIVKQVLSDSPSLQEILWNFSHFKDKKKRLTLRENPHFYAKLPTSPEAYGGSVKIDPTENFRHANKFYVLTDKPELVYIMTGQVLQTFGNFWCPKNAIIFKDICGRLRGESIVRGSYWGFCKLLPVSTAPGASTGRRGLQPIITGGCPWKGWKCSIDCFPVHSSVDIGVCVCTGRVSVAPDTSPLLPVVPLPPTSEQPGYSVAYKSHVHILDNDSLLQIFNCHQLEDELSWNFRLIWLMLAHVCRRWRYLIYGSSSLLDLRITLTNNTPSLDTLSHLPPLPLIIDYRDTAGTMARKDEENIHLGLQRHGLIREVALQAPSSRLRMWLEPMNKLFPILGDLSLLSTTTDGVDPMLPEMFQAPDLRHLKLHGICLPKGLSLLSSTIALSTLSLTHIGASGYFPPGLLVTQLQGLPHLEELSIGFAIPIRLPNSEGELLPAIPPVILPSLRQLTFRGVDVYLDNLVAQIDTPRLEELSLTLFFDLAFTLVGLTEFIHRTEGFGCVSAEIIFNKHGHGVSICTDDSYKDSQLRLHINCEPLDWQIDSATQVCSALEKVLCAVEELTLDLDVSGMRSDWENILDSLLWHELLLLFIGVKELHIRPSLKFVLSKALESVAGGMVLELLPELQGIHVQPDASSHGFFSSVNHGFFAFVETRAFVGRPVYLKPGIPSNGQDDSESVEPA